MVEEGGDGGAVPAVREVDHDLGGWRACADGRGGGVEELGERVVPAAGDLTDRPEHAIVDFISDLSMTVGSVYGWVG